MHSNITRLFSREQLIYLGTFGTLVLVTIGCLSLLKVTLNKHSNFSEPKWKTATFLPDSLKKKFKSDELDNSRNWGTFFQEVVATKVEVNGHSLFIIDTSINKSDQNPLCGIKGCLITAYINNDGKWLQVLNGYFQPFSLTDKPNLELQNVFSSMPCVNITEIENTKTYCYDNQEKKYFRKHSAAS
ncbi:MAG: hypothetical protein F6K22_02405 [Okeania sp. SIO2F4]|uniref:hypothetical protein n=1 Tax=Okeania sp. SIO2F4 TaxID=2607790 RepID=UPI00142AE912|nr:hypothetical protein [Okeania sp. SIO2F4]NES01775.1 hypothetical protein [Okeania sp. SIO2F4]